MDGQRPQQMPIGKTIEGRGVVVFVQTTRQFRDRDLIKRGKSFRRDRCAGGNGLHRCDGNLTAKCGPESCG